MDIVINFKGGSQILTNKWDDLEKQLDRKDLNCVFVGHELIFSPDINRIDEFRPKAFKEKGFKKITDSLADLLEYKNSKYGDSALNPLGIFQGKSKVGYRIDDKLARVKNSKVLSKNDVADLVGYLVLVCVENGWEDFNEFKD